MKKGFIMRKYSFLFLFLLLHYAVRLNSQPAIEWQRSLGGSQHDYGTVVKQTSDGGYILAGYSYSGDGDVAAGHGYADYWILKLNNSGLVQWQRPLGGSSADVAKSIEQTGDGGYIIAGGSYSINGDVTGNRGGSDYWIVKLNSTGNIEWQKSMGGTENDEAQSIRQTNDGGYIVAGWSYSDNRDVTGHHPGPRIKGKPQVNADYWVVKLNNIGNILWQRSLGGSYDDRAYSIRQTNDGGFIVAGYSNSNNGDVTGHHGFTGLSEDNSDYWLVKLSNTGNIQFQKSLGGDRKDAAYCVEETIDGGFIVAGESKSNNGDVSGHHGLTQSISQFCIVTPDYWVVRLNSTGVIQWQRSLGGNGYDIAWSVSQTNDGKFVIAGYTGSNDGEVSNNHGPQSLQLCSAHNSFFYDFWIVQLDNTGSLQWQKCIGGANHDVARSVQQTNDGGFVIMGESAALNGDVTGNHGGYDYSIVKLGPGNTTPGVQRSILQNEATVLSFNIYPNPAQKQVNVYFPGKNLYEDVTLSLLNAFGQKVKQIPISSASTTTTLTGLSSGLYVYQVRSGRKILHTGKLIIK